MPNEKTLAVLLRLDGVVHTSDLSVQSFARHLTEVLPAELVRPMIAGMRGFLENKPELIPAGMDFGHAEDGYQAVEQLALAAGLTPAEIEDAWRASRTDLAGSAWAVDAADGLAELIGEVAPHGTITVFSEPDDPAGLPLLAALELAGPLGSAPVPLPAAIARLQGTLLEPNRLLVVGTRWHGELDAAAAAGCVTALVDRYQLDAGTPHWRATDLTGLLAPIRTWMAAVVAAPERAVS